MCRTSGGPCENDVYCNGASSNCPANNFKVQLPLTLRCPLAGCLPSVFSLLVLLARLLLDHARIMCFVPVIRHPVTPSISRYRPTLHQFPSSSTDLCHFVTLARRCSL